MMSPNSVLSEIILPEMGSTNIYFAKNINVTINLFGYLYGREDTNDTTNNKRTPSRPTFEDQCSTYDDLVNIVHDRIASNRGGTIEDIRTIDKYEKEFKRTCLEILDEKNNMKRKEPKSFRGFFTTIKTKITGAWDKAFGKKSKAPSPEEVK